MTAFPAPRVLRIGGQLALGLMTLATPLLGLLFVTFLISRVMPIDPVRSIVGERATEAQIQAIRDTPGLDLPMWRQFAINVGDALTGDLGRSIRTGKEMATEIARCVPATLELATLGTIFGILVGVPAGVLAATRPGSIASQIVRVVAHIGYSMPVFWLGPIGLMVLCGQLDWVAGAGRNRGRRRGFRHAEHGVGHPVPAGRPEGADMTPLCAWLQDPSPGSRRQARLGRLRLARLRL